MAIIVMKENIKNWKELIIEYLNKFQLVDHDLIEELQKIVLFSEEMLITFLNKGEDWQLDFVREFLISNPEKLDVWLYFITVLLMCLNFLSPQKKLGRLIQI